MLITKSMGWLTNLVGPVMYYNPSRYTVVTLVGDWVVFLFLGCFKFNESMQECIATLIQHTKTHTGWNATHCLRNLK